MVLSDLAISVMMVLGGLIFAVLLYIAICISAFKIFYKEYK